MTAMNAKRRICTALLVLLTLPAAQGQVAAVPDTAALRRPFGAEDAAAFVAPPRINYPQTWFHLIGGNVSAEGITEDFEAIARTGISGAVSRRICALAGCRSADSGAQSGVGRAGASCGPGSSAAGFALHDAELFGLGDLGRSVDRTVERHAAPGMEPHGFVGGGRPGRPAAARVGRRGVARLPRHCGAGLPDAARRHGRVAPARGRGERGRPALARSDRRNEPRTAATSALRGGRLRAARDHVPRGGRGPHRRAAEHEQHQPSPLLRAGDRADGGGRGAGRFAEAGAARRGSGEQLAGQHAGFVRLRRRLSRDPLPGGAFEPPSHDPRVAEILYRRAEELLGVGGGLDPPQSGPGERLPEAEPRGVDRPGRIEDLWMDK